MSRVVALLIADNRLARWLAFGLEQQGYLALVSAQAESELQRPSDDVLAWRPDLWLVSASLWRQLRGSALRHARQDGDWQVFADDSGTAAPADAWPLEPRALLLHLHEYFATRRDAHERVLQHGSLRLDCLARAASVGHLPLDLSAQGFRLLQLFMQHPARIFSRQQLLDLVWGDYGGIELRSVDAQVYRLRRQLEEHGQGGLLESVRGQGYRLRNEPRRMVPLDGRARFSI